MISKCLWNYIEMTVALAQLVFHENLVRDYFSVQMLVGLHCLKQFFYLTVFVVLFVWKLAECS